MINELKKLIAKEQPKLTGTPKKEILKIEKPKTTTVLPKLSK